MRVSPLERIYIKNVNLDVVIYLVWLLLLLLLVATLKLRYFSVLFPIIFANIGIVIFLFFKERGILHRECETDPVKREKNNSIKINRTIPVISIIFFFIFFSLSLLSLLGENYTKSIPYYLCISICTAILIFEIFSIKSVISRYGILFQALLLSLNIVLANHLIYIHGISQQDFNIHFSLIWDILTSGHISPNTVGLYNIFAAHHVFASEIALLTGYNPQPIYLLFGSFIIAIGVLFVFIIGKRFVNFQFGLVAAVVFTCLDFYLMWGEHPEHVAYSFGFALVCFTIVLYTYKTQKAAFYLLFGLSAIAMVLTHHFSALIIFVTICSLVLIDIFHTVQTRDRLFPSKYIAATFAILLFAALYIVSEGNLVQYAFNYFGPYFMRINSLTANFFPSPAPVISIPVTSISHEQLVSPSVSPSTVFDRLPLTILFINTLGSSLLVFISILGFCSLIKKRLWFGDYSIINAILLSFLLGFGMLIPIQYPVFLPDRMYPFLQIFGLVFLGAFGIVWLRNSFPTRNGFIIIACICILVAVMSFFSLASIINGFETSPLVDENIAYHQLYTTSQDASFGEWRSSFIHNEKQNVLSLPINDKGSIDIDSIQGNSYLVFNRTIEKTGIVKYSRIFGQHSFFRFDNGQLQQLNTISSYYDNGLINLVAKNAPS